MTELLKIATWNVNSIRTRIGQVTDWLQRNNVDIILLQELKCTKDQFPFEVFEDLGYNSYTNCQKTYNGVAVISKFRADGVIYDFAQNPCPEEARYIEIKFSSPIGYLSVTSVYVPNGTSLDSENFIKKIRFLNGLKIHLAKNNLRDYYIIGGDFNVAPRNEDVFSPEEFENKLLFTESEKSIIRSIKYSGLVDPAEYLTQETRFTWWDYRAGALQKDQGARIDYFLVSPGCCANLHEICTDKSERKKEKASDHAPVLLTLSSINYEKTL
ncbi:MAG: exodeoxyribonuclease III [Rickettsiaceae bacterium]|nr:exodeoxyribonuclease III [Rickettsiaceae bacterium]